MLNTLIVALVLGPIQTPSPAKDLLQKAQASASKRGTSVMVIFHASWCGWCKRLDAFMAKPQYKTVFEKNYEIVHLDVMENPGKEALENPGGEDVMKKWGGEKAGLPFTVILDKTGKMVISSLKDGKPTGNIGCPWEPEEVAWFLAMIDKTKSNMSTKERQDLEAGLLAQKTEKGGGR